MRFRKGDRVQIARRSAVHNMPFLGAYLNEVGTIVKVTKNGPYDYEVQLRSDFGVCFFMHDELEHVKSIKKLKEYYYGSRKYSKGC